ncbi:MAG: hypothetical protein E5Y88_22300 [Mesorhizobium sp.]|uniref:hypothetical protein n=1 Tax=Mesorhizobium sp. TaxID=1871066 RepID=UPI001200D41F|nr:hypothetical protein [Mesorhizobium sp.]TIL23661.1 MAG: hypothetical protein E5Y88_22300 [Mesorhizobium sp.]
MTMVLLLAATGAIVVFASYLSKWDAQKRMKKLREEEKAFKDKVSKFRAKEVASLEAQGASAVALSGVDVAKLAPKFEAVMEMARGLGGRVVMSENTPFSYFRFQREPNFFIFEHKPNAPAPRRVKSAASTLIKGTRHG